MTFFQAIEEWFKGSIPDQRIKLLLKMELAAFVEELPTLEKKHKDAYEPEIAFPDSPNRKWSEEQYWDYCASLNAVTDTKLAIKKIECFLADLENEQPSQSIPPIIWNGSQADLARIYKDLKDSGIVNTTARDFSKHFLTKQGEPMPEDFTESKGYKQPEYSKNGTVSGVQNTIRGMKQESGE